MIAHAKTLTLYYYDFFDLFNQSNCLITLNYTYTPVPNENAQKSNCCSYMELSLLQHAEMHNGHASYSISDGWCLRIVSHIEQLLWAMRESMALERNQRSGLIIDIYCFARATSNWREERKQTENTAILWNSYIDELQKRKISLTTKAEIASQSNMSLYPHAIDNIAWKIISHACIDAFLIQKAYRLELHPSIKL